MIVPNVNNEWESLRKVIIGNVVNSQIPPFKDKSLHCVDYAHLSTDQFQKIPTGKYPNKIIEETREDLSNIKNILRSLGVVVLNSQSMTPTKQNRPYHDSYYDYCPRDSMLVIGDKVIQTPMALRQRRDEADKYKHMFNPDSWVRFPKPILEDGMYDRTDLSKPTLRNSEPVFDAANVLKSNNDIIYLVSNTGNLAGADYLEKWLWDNVSTDYKVHRVEGVYAHIHIDTTFVLLREGLVLCNPARVNEINMPQIFRNWDRIWAPEPYPTQVMDEWCPASEWLGMNILSINENLVMVEEHQLLLMNLLKKYGIDSIPVKLRHSRTLSGGPHCITLDVIRSNKPFIDKQRLI
jgi:glycine amidinotransferase/scyllo-inosamine-4-phosphate amidinotransferase 1